MRKLFILLLSVISLTVFAQQKKVAVYVVSSEAGITKVMGDQLVNAFAKSEKYIAVERTSSFLTKINEEHNYQQSGAVDDAELSRLGVQFGVQYVCVSEISDAFGEKYVSARLIDVESSEIVNSFSASGKIDNMDDCIKLATIIATNLTKGTYSEQEDEQKERQLELENGIYWGQVKNGKPHGHGKLTYNSSDDHLTYDGEWVNGLQNGNGTMIWKDNTKYEGEWKDGLRSGYGTMMYFDGDEYVGFWYNGKRNGKGKLTWKNDEGFLSCDGDWKDGALNGVGTLLFKNGDKYIGNFENGDMTGYGKYYWRIGHYYEGEYKKGKRDGYGIMILNDGDKYEGEFFNDVYHGKGVYTYSDGERYEGIYKNGKRNGKGIYYFNDGDYEYEYYIDGKQDGEWIRITPNGKRYKSKYSNGRQIRGYH